jgi:Carbohydrate binding module (family 6)
LPGTIEAEDFDNDGAEVAYHDGSDGNSGGAYRNTDVDLESTTDTGGGYNVGWATAGEWLNYSVAVGIAGNYTMDVRIACLGGGGTFHIEVNGLDRTGPIAVPDTGDWQSWITVSRTGVALPAGLHVLRLVMDSDGSNGATGNFNWMRVVDGRTGSTPFTGTPVALPGTIEAEAFDNGGSDIAYHDASGGTVAVRIAVRMSISNRRRTSVAATTSGGRSQVSG